MRREYPDSPIASVAAVLFSGNRVLLTLRLNEPSRGRWSLPGGVVELGETVEDALKRELLEETGILARPEKLLTVFDSIVKDDEGRVRYHYVLSEHLCTLLGGELRASSDVGQVRWVPVEELDSLEMNPGTRRFIRRVAEEHGIREDFNPTGSCR